MKLHAIFAIPDSLKVCYVHVTCCDFDVVHAKSSNTKQLSGNNCNHLYSDCEKLFLGLFILFWKLFVTKISVFHIVCFTLT